MNRPFFEMEVVKAKKVKKEWTPECCPCCGAKSEVEKAIGNWVNGENLDKIKFPVPCSYEKLGGEKLYGLLIFEWANKYNTEKVYKLLPLKKQNTHISTTLGEYESLKQIIETYNIHILKGKIIIFEEEEK